MGHELVEAEHDAHINEPINSWRKYGTGYAEREWFDEVLAKGIAEGRFTADTKPEALRNHIREQSEP